MQKLSVFWSKTRGKTCKEKSKMESWKDGKTGQPTKELDGCNKMRKQGCQVGRKMAANQRGKEAWKMAKRKLKKCPKGLKMGVKEGSQLRRKLAAKFWQTGQPNKGKYGCK